MGVSAAVDGPKRSAGKAITALTFDPPPAVSEMQRRAATWLLRPYPHGLRFSGINMSPLPMWLAGAQCACLNMTNNDVPTQVAYNLLCTTYYLLLTTSLHGNVAGLPQSADSVSDIDT